MTNGKGYKWRPTDWVNYRQQYDVIFQRKPNANEIIGDRVSVETNKEDDSDATGRCEHCGTCAQKDCSPKKNRKTKKDS